jgi:hypothetical protein
MHRRQLKNMAPGRVAGWLSNDCPSVIPSIGRSPLSMTLFLEFGFLTGKPLPEPGTTAVFGGQLNEFFKSHL